MLSWSLRDLYSWRRYFRGGKKPSFSQKGRQSKSPAMANAFNACNQVGRKRWDSKWQTQKERVSRVTRSCRRVINTASVCGYKTRFVHSQPLLGFTKVKNSHGERWNRGRVPSLGALCGFQLSASGSMLFFTRMNKSKDRWEPFYKWMVGWFNPSFTVGLNALKKHNKKNED